jgi:hypothetical protein
VKAHILDVVCDVGPGEDEVLEGFEKALVGHHVAVGVLGPTAHPGLPLKVFLGVGRCRQL